MEPENQNLIKQVEKLQLAGHLANNVIDSNHGQCFCKACVINRERTKQAVDESAATLSSSLTSLKKLIDEVFESEKRPKHDEWCGDGAMCCTCNFSEHRKHMEDLRKRIGELL